MIKIGNTYKFNVIGSNITRKGDTMYKLSLSDSNDETHYFVYPLKCQLEEKMPTTIYCKVVDIDEYGRVKLKQDEYSLFSSHYEPNKVYTFHVDSNIEDSKAGKKRYDIISPFNLKHIYTSHHNEELIVGEDVQLSVTVKQGIGCNAILYFNMPNQSLNDFSPEIVFSSCGHKEDYESFFLHIGEWRELSKRISSSMASMEDKLKMNSRLWLFDYLTVLFYISMSIDKEELDTIEKFNILIRDIETWMLEESGILTTFNPEKREETRLKSEQVISRAESAIEAINIIRNGKQSSFLNNVLNKLRKSMYLRNRNHVFSVLYHLIVLEHDFLKNNIAELSEFIEFTSHEITDTYILERLVSMLSGHINNEKKLINAELHYKRITDTDNKLLSNLIIGIGTLLNFHYLKGFIDEGEYGISPRQLFPTLCKYLSYMASKEKALQLINKSLLFTLKYVKTFRLDGNTLRKVQEAPDILVDYILNMPLMETDITLLTNRENIYMQYLNGLLSITYIPSKLRIKKVDSLLHNVYSIPGTILNVGSFTENEMWENSDSVLYYKDKWKELFSTNEFQISSQDESTYVNIVTKEINHTFTNLVFCTRKDSIFREDGIIHYSGYTPKFKADYLDEIFQENMYFVAKMDRQENGRVNFDITDNIQEFSNYLAEQVENTVLGLCLNINLTEQEAIFITETGILCSTALPSNSHIKNGETYELSIDISTKQGQLPIAMVLGKKNKQLNRIQLLRNQLSLLSDYNQDNYKAVRNPLKAKDIPYIHLIIDDYLRLYEDKIIRYNLYQIARLISLSEKSTLSNYYASCIQYMEMVESFIENEPLDYSLPNFVWDEKIQTQFPTLRNYTEMHNLLNSFGTENDFEYLFRLAVNPNTDEQICRFARLSLAASLIESVSDDERPIPYLRAIVAESLGGTIDKKHIPIDISSDAEDSINESNARIQNFGNEGQLLEFKTSIVFPAGNEEHRANLDEQMFVILKVIAGFLNAKGGTLLIGVKDDGSVSGIEADYAELNCNADKYERIIRNKIVNSFNKDVNGTIDISFIKSGNKQICKIIAPQYETPIALDGEFYQRQGNEIRIIKGNDLTMFIRRRIEGKSTIIEEKSYETSETIERSEKLGEIEHEVISSQSSMLPPPNPIKTEAFELVVNFYNDGNYLLSKHADEINSIANIGISYPMNNSYMLQCYDNGCVNKMPIKNFYNMQLGYRYKNGLSRDAVLKNLMVLSNADYIVVVSNQQKCKYVKVVPVSDISAHTALGLKGNQLLSQNYDAVEGWYPLSAKDAVHVSRLITITRTNLGWKMSSPAYKEEVIWLSQNIIEKTSSHTIDTNKYNSNPLQLLLQEHNSDKIITYFDELISKGNLIPKARAEAQELLNLCNNADDFWFIISSLLSCDISIFRKPLTEVILHKNNLSTYAPAGPILTSVVKRLFTFDHKYTQSIDLIYPFRQYLSDDLRDYIYKSTSNLSEPEDYDRFFELTNINTDKAVDFLIAENTIASSYTLYELLNTFRNNHNNISYQNYIRLCLKRIPVKTTANRYIHDLVTVFILREEPSFFKRKALIELKSGGFKTFREICIAKADKDKKRNLVAHLEDYVGKIVSGKIIQDYQNHYLISSNDISILLQHSWAAKKHFVDDSLSVKITSVSKSHKTMFGTEIDDTYELPPVQPLLEIGTEVEVKFSELNGGYIPDIKKAFSQIKARVISYPDNFDFRKKYAAIVTREKGKFEFDIRLKHIIS